MTNLTVVDQIYAVPLTDIIANEDANCRDKIDPLKVLNLWRTIERDGLLQPVVLRKTEKGLELLCGYRRFKAHVVGCAKTINAKIVECSDMDAKAFNLIENLERENLNLLEEAKAVEKLLFLGWTVLKISKRMNVTPSWVNVRLKLLKLPEAIRQEAAAGFLKMGHVDALAKLTVPEQYEAVKVIKEKSMRGEKTPVAVLAPKTPNHVATKRMRNKDEVSTMLGIVSKKLDYGIETRILAWVTGAISTDDLIFDIEKECLK